jgi:hypothetical protein
LNSPLIAGPQLVAIGRPGNCEHARIEMTASAFMVKPWFSIVAKNVTIGPFSGRFMETSWLAATLVATKSGYTKPNSAGCTPAKMRWTLAASSPYMRWKSPANIAR